MVSFQDEKRNKNRTEHSREKKQQEEKREMGTGRRRLGVVRRVEYTWYPVEKNAEKTGKNRGGKTHPAQLETALGGQLALLKWERGGMPGVTSSKSRWRRPYKQNAMYGAAGVRNLTLLGAELKKGS